MDVKKVVGKILTGAVDAYNSFEEPEKVKLEGLGDVKMAEGKVSFEIPPCSVVLVSVS